MRARAIITSMPPISHCRKIRVYINFFNCNLCTCSCPEVSHAGKTAFTEKNPNWIIWDNVWHVISLTISRKIKRERPSSRHVVLGLYAFRIRNYTEVGTRKIVDIRPRKYPKRRTTNSAWLLLKVENRVLTARNDIIFHTRKGKNKSGGEKRKPDDTHLAVIVRQKANCENANSVAPLDLELRGSR